MTCTFVHVWRLVVNGTLYCVPSRSDSQCMCLAAATHSQIDICSLFRCTSRTQHAHSITTQGSHDTMRVRLQCLGLLPSDSWEALSSIPGGVIDAWCLLLLLVLAC